MTEGIFDEKKLLILGSQVYRYFIIRDSMVLFIFKIKFFFGDNFRFTEELQGW